MGIGRLTVLLLDQTAIREVIVFPALRMWDAARRPFNRRGRKERRETERVLCALAQLVAYSKSARWMRVTYGRAASFASTSR
ncbi:MAG: hypothetical protein HZB53_20105 [Chloroflexi bacterium]|nr:hypothetical protein [Chloroflexota bacterium]